MTKGKIVKLIKHAKSAIKNFYQSDASIQSHMTTMEASDWSLKIVPGVTWNNLYDCQYSCGSKCFSFLQNISIIKSAPLFSSSCVQWVDEVDQGCYYQKWQHCNILSLAWRAWQLSASVTRLCSTSTLPRRDIRLMHPHRPHRTAEAEDVLVRNTIICLVQIAGGGLLFKVLIKNHLQF